MLLGRSRCTGLVCLCRSLSTTVTVGPNGVLGAKTSIDPVEIQCFTAMANGWFDENGPMRILHAFNRVRIPWIVDELKKVTLNPLINLLLL